MEIRLRPHTTKSASSRCARCPCTSNVQGHLAHVVILLVAMSYWLIAAPTAQAGLSRAPNNLGLVGYWSFNEGVGLKAGDYSGQGNHGTLTNGPRWSAGKFGGGLTFDGTDDYVEVADSASLDSAGGTSYAYGMWIKTTSTTNTALLEKGDNGFFMLQPNVGGADLFINSIDLVTGGWTPFRDGQWHHLFVVYDVSANTATLYKDGASIAVVTSAGGSSANNSPLRIGSRAGAYPIAAVMDDIRIYNRAIGANEVTRLYNTGGVAKVQSAASEAGTGLVGHWKLDDRTGTRAIDSSGQGNNGTLTNFALSGATSNWAFGYRAGALTFDGTNDYVTVTDAAPLQMTGDMSISLWAYPNTSSQTSILVDKGSSWTNNITYGIGLSSGVWRWLHGNSYQASSGVTASVGAWNHVVGVRTTSNTTITWYVNGALVTGASYTTAPVTNSITLGIGDEGGATHPSAPFNGSIDDVRIYNRALTAEQIKALYTSGTSRPAVANANSASLTAGTNLASGLVGHWSFDGKYLSTTTARDTSGQGNDGTLTNGPVPIMGRLGQALSFDGVDDNVVVPHSESWNSSDMSAAMWVKWNTLGDTMFLSHNSGATGGGFEFDWQTSSSRLIWAANGSVGVLIPWTPVANRWYHIAFSRNGSANTTEMFVDGVSIGSGSQATDTASVTGVLNIGNYSYGGYGMDGQMDDVRIYNRALSAQEVKQLYYLGK